MSRNELTLSVFIRDLQQLIDSGKVSPDATVWIAEQYPYSNHRYQIADWQTNKEEDDEEPEHTCDEECICTAGEDGSNMDQHFTPNNPDCPYCFCPACESDDVVSTGDELYLTMGDQSPLPDNLVSTGEV